MIRNIYSASSTTSGLYVDSMHMNYASMMLCLYRVSLIRVVLDIELKDSVAQPEEIQYIGSPDSTSSWTEVGDCTVRS